MTAAFVASFDAPFFFHTLFGPDFIEPFLLVVLVTFVSQTAGIILGFPLALGRLSGRRLIRAPVDLYLFVFRGTPLLLQILFVYFGTDEISGHSPLLYPLNRNAVIAGIVTLALNEAAYMAEIIRAGLQAVDPGQVDAAKALGMTWSQTMRRIVVPQALRVIVPPTTNEYINMSKSTSLLSTIAVTELLYEAQGFYSVNFRFFEALSVAACWYLVLYVILVSIQGAVERRFGERGDGGGPGLLERLLRSGGPLAPTAIQVPTAGPTEP